MKSKNLQKAKSTYRLNQVDETVFHSWHIDLTKTQNDLLFYFNSLVYRNFFLLDVQLLPLPLVLGIFYEWALKSLVADFDFEQWLKVLLNFLNFLTFPILFLLIFEFLDFVFLFPDSCFSVSISNIVYWNILKFLSIVTPKVFIVPFASTMIGCFTV